MPPHIIPQPPIPQEKKSHSGLFIAAGLVLIAALCVGIYMQFVPSTPTSEITQNSVARPIEGTLFLTLAPLTEGSQGVYAFDLGAKTLTEIPL